MPHASTEIKKLWPKALLLMCVEFLHSIHIPVFYYSGVTLIMVEPSEINAKGLNFAIYSKSF